MPRRTLYDSSDAAAIAKAEKEEADRSKDFEYILKEPRGRRWLHDLIFDTCHAEQLSHVPGDAASSAFNEGAKSVGLALLKRVREDHTALYLKMLEENLIDG